MFAKIRAARAAKQEIAERSAHVGRLSFCERITASPTSPYHVRVIDEAGFKTTGGVSVPTICGDDLHRGWDVSEKSYSVDEALSLSRQWIANEFLHATCSRCVVALEQGSFQN